ncbi:MAG TPA: glutamine synthetase family protein [Actinocrinis sp.]|uniref:glutamine synthetase family protein n=1 Tax=Actinocrinis sp. TaxID=1920516 RepID=UPI002DDCDCBE|nr:glutamine synthetase family protein [Actinocrinis sp.]HEV2346995.1 glutamine synthetase family protein [Actinocrinis sp.]
MSTTSIAQPENDTGATPRGILSTDELLERTGSGQIDTVLVAVPGPSGLLRGKAYDAGYFAAHVLESGTRAAAYLLTTDPDMRVLPGFAFGGWEHGAGDLWLRTDAATLRTAGWAPRTALVLADPCDRQGRPIPVAPRAVLARQLHRLADLGLTASLGVESEAMVYDTSYGDAARRGWRDLPPAADHNTDYALTHPARLTALIERIRETAYATGLPLEGIKTEAGAGQLEVTFRHGEPMAAADQHAVYKLLAHHAAEHAGMALTFMAKPFTGRDGNSCHLHLSLLDDQERSLLVDAHGRLTDLGQHAVAGCLAALDQLAVLMLPSVNAYKRLHTDTAPLFAPTTLSWGYDNRTCALRVLGAGESGRIECRIPGADAQPHLAAAALIAAVAYGTEQKLPLDEHPVAASAYDDPHATFLPRTLPEAAARMQDSALAAELLGVDVVAHYVRAAWHEAEYHRRRVSDLERERGFARA